MPRLFVALRLPAEAAERLEDIAFGLSGAAWTSADQYHLTLRFIGEPGSPGLDGVDAALREVRAEAFRFDLKGVGHFPLRGEPEALWAGVAPCEPLLRLRHRVESALGRAGLPPEGRKFHPHVTLARLKGARIPEIGFFEAQHGLLRIGEIPAQEFLLFSSRLRPEGAVHTVEARYPLEGLLEGDPL